MSITYNAKLQNDREKRYQHTGPISRRKSCERCTSVFNSLDYSKDLRRCVSLDISQKQLRNYRRSTGDIQVCITQPEEKRPSTSSLEREQNSANIAKLPCIEKDSNLPLSSSKQIIPNSDACVHERKSANSMSQTCINVTKYPKNINESSLHSITPDEEASMMDPPQEINPLRKIVLTRPLCRKNIPYTHSKNNDFLASVVKSTKSSGTISPQNDYSNVEQCMSARDENKNNKRRSIQMVVISESNQKLNTSKNKDLDVSATENKTQDMNSRPKISKGVNCCKTPIVIPTKASCARSSKVVIVSQADYDKLSKDKPNKGSITRKGKCPGEETNWNGSRVLKSKKRKYLSVPSRSTFKSKGRGLHRDVQTYAPELSERQTSTTTLGRKNKTTLRKSDKMEIVNDLSHSPKCQRLSKTSIMPKEERMEAHQHNKNMSNAHRKDPTIRKLSYCTDTKSVSVCSNQSEKNHMVDLNDLNIFKCHAVTNVNSPGCVLQEKVLTVDSSKPNESLSQKNPIVNTPSLYVPPYFYQNDYTPFTIQPMPTAWIPPAPQGGVSNFVSPTILSSWRPEEMQHGITYPPIIEAYPAPTTFYSPGICPITPGDGRMYMPVPVEQNVSRNHRKSKRHPSNKRSRQSHKTTTSSSENSSHTSHPSRNRRNKKRRSRSRYSTVPYKEDHFLSEWTRSHDKKSQSRDRTRSRDMRNRECENKISAHFEDFRNKAYSEQSHHDKITLLPFPVAGQCPIMNERQQMIPAENYREYEPYPLRPWPYEYFYWAPANMLPEHSTLQNSQQPPNKRYLPYNGN